MTDKYFVARDADTIAKFVAKVLAREYKYQLYKADNSRGLPKAIGKDAKWPAYEAAGRIERTLGLDTHASSVAELAALAGKAHTYLNTF